MPLVGPTPIYGGNPPQEGDVLLYQTLNDGEINCTVGIIEMTPDFDTMVYLVLHGSNDDDPGGDDKSKQWWGNFSEPDTDKHYRSEYANLIQGIPATSGNLRLVEAAAQRDLEKAFVSTGIADTVTVTATIPQINSLLLTIEIEAQGNKSEYTFTENWENSIL